MRRSLFLIPILCLAAAACQKELPARLEVVQDVLSVESPAGRAQLEFTATRSWTATTDAPWCRVVPDSGNGVSDVPRSLQIIYEENQGHSERACVLTIKSDGHEKTVTLVQGHKEGVILDTGIKEISDLAQAFDIRLWTTEPVSATLDPACENWLTLVNTKAMTEVAVTLSATLNRSAAREGKLYIRHGGDTETVIIHQAASDIPLSNPLFKDYCVSAFDSNKDGCLSIEEALNAKELFIGYVPVTQKDLSYFPNVEYAEIHGSEGLLDLSPLKKLRKIDIRASCTQINLKENTQLEDVRVYHSRLRTLDLSGNGMLKFLTIEYNDVLESVVLDGCQILQRAAIMFNASLSSLDFQTCKNAEEIKIWSCQALLNVTACRLPLLSSVEFYDCPALDTINLQECPSLRELYINASTIRDLRLNGSTSLTQFHGNGITMNTLDLSACPGLESIDISESNIESFHLGDKPALQSLVAYTAHIESIDLTHCPNLTRLFLNENALTSLDLSLLPALQRLSCSHNQLTTLDISSCPELIEVSANDNRLRSFTARNNPKLQSFGINNNELTTIDLTGCQSLAFINVSNNRFESLDFNSVPSLVHLYCTGNHLKQINVRGCPSLNELYCSDNSLTTLDLTGNPALAYLECQNNPALKTVYLLSSARLFVLNYDAETTTLVYR